MPTARLPPPKPVFDLMNAYWGSACLRAGIRLRVFDAVAEGHDTPLRLAVATGADERGIRILCNALCSLGVLGKTPRKAQDRYVLPPVARAYLLSSDATFLGGRLGATMSDVQWLEFGRLEEIVRKGSPLREETSATPDAAFWNELVLAIMPQGKLVAEDMARVLGVGRKLKGSRVLDVGCGSGIYGITLLRADGAATMVGVDWPRIVDVAATQAEKLGVAERVSFLEGDMLTLDWKGPYDVVVVSNVFHQFGPGECTRLVDKAWRALAPGGALIINDDVADDGRKKARHALLFAVVMLLHTPEGDTYTFGEYKAWLAARGFTGVRKHPTRGPGELIVARKPGPSSTGTPLRPQAPAPRRARARRG